MKKVLIIRFSSFGDIVQAMPACNFIKDSEKNVEITWLTKEQFKGIVELSDQVDRVMTISNKTSLWQLIKFSFSLRKEKFNLVFDAHSNLRSLVIKFILKRFNFKTNFITRPKDRFKRILLFKFGINKLPNPFKGMVSYSSIIAKKDTQKIEHLQKWNFSDKTIKNVQGQVPFLNKKFLLFAPSAAWQMKRWPIEHWKKLTKDLINVPIVFVGGGNDTFIDQISQEGGELCLNLAGDLSLAESCYLVSRSHLVVSADTGIIHVADILGVSGLSLLGPTAFGFPTNSNIKRMEVDLDCRPCTKDGRGSCSQDVYQKCMVEITPEKVLKEVKSFYSSQ